MRCGARIDSDRQFSAPGSLLRRSERQKLKANS